MGACCGSGSSDDIDTVPRRPTTYNTNARNNGGGNAAGGESSPAGAPKNATKGSNNNNNSGGGQQGTQADEMSSGTNGGNATARTHTRERAVMALMDSIHKGEHVVPTRRWRQMYIKTNGVGADVAMVLTEFLESCNESRTRRAKKSVEERKKVKTASVSVASDLQSVQSVSIVDNGVLGRRNSVQYTQQMKQSPGVRDGKHSIRTLDLRALKMGDDAFVKLMECVAKDTLLQYVLFPGNCLTEAGLVRLEQVLSSAKTPPGSALKLLSLCDNPIAAQGCETLERILPFFPEITQVELGKGQSAAVSSPGTIDEDEGEYFTTATIESLLRTIEKTPKLETVLVKGTGKYHNMTGFNARGLSLFVEGAVGRPKLRQLFLQDCYTTQILEAGGLAKTFFDPASTRNTTDGADNSSAGGTSDMASPLGKASAEEEHIVLQPIHALGKALATSSTTVTTLVLRFPFSDDATKVLGEGLRAATVLENLSLRNCELTAAGLYYIAAAMEANRSIRVLDVSFQCSLVTHPAVLAENRSSSKRKCSQQYRTHLQDSAFPREGEERVGNRERPLQPLVHALRQNRTIEQLLMIGIIVTIADLEDLCATIERHENHVISTVAYTNLGLDALNMRLDNLLETNKLYGGGGAGGGDESPSASHPRPNAVNNTVFSRDSTPQAATETATPVEPARLPLIPSAAAPKPATTNPSFDDDTMFSSPGSPNPRDVTGIRSPSHEDRMVDINATAAPADTFNVPNKYLNLDEAEAVDSEGDDTTTAGGNNTTYDALMATNTGARLSAGDETGDMDGTLRRFEEDDDDGAEDDGDGAFYNYHGNQKPIKLSDVLLGAATRERSNANNNSKRDYFRPGVKQDS